MNIIMLILSVDLSIALLVLIYLAFLSIRFKLVDRTGTIAAFIIGLITLIFGGWKWFAILLTFYFLASFFTKYRYDLKCKLGVAEAKGGARAWTNVIGNGGVAALFAFAEGLLGGGAFFGGFLGAISTAAADTLATELGLLYPRNPRLITNLRRKVPPGTSGAVSPYGEFAIFMASAIIGLIAIAINVDPCFSPIKILAISMISGFIGSTFDSFLGATIQAQYWCEKCGKMSETPIHICGARANLVKGISFLNNHLVNFISTALGGLMGYSLSFIL